MKELRQLIREILPMSVIIIIGIVKIFEDSDEITITLSKVSFALIITILFVYVVLSIVEFWRDKNRNSEE